MWFSLGLLMGGALSASALLLASGLTEPLSDWVASGLLLAVAAVAVLRDAGVLRFPLPENRRLVPQTIFRKAPRRAALQFGLEMGTGVRTYVPASSPYVLAVALLLLAPAPSVFALSGAFFGVGRAITPWFRLVAPDQEAWDGTLDASTRSIAMVTSVASLVCALTVVW
jgi:hypothetical protein